MMDIKLLNTDILTSMLWVGSAVFMVQDPTLNAAEVNGIVILLAYCFPDQHAKRTTIFCQITGAGGM
jgi:hypothetical protein